jgi:antirestriction protein ArdC
MKTGHAPTMFKTYKQWKEMDRYVKKGEKATHFLRPISFKTKRTNHVTGEEEEIVKTIFKYYPVFEAHQTSGKPFRKQNLIKGEVSFTVQDIIDAIKVPVEAGNDGSATGSTDGKTIWLNFNNNENTLISTLFHELGHYYLHFPSIHHDTKTEELEAEAVSFVVTRLLGLENEKSKKYILGWAKEDAQDLLVENRARIFDAVNKVLEAIKPVVKGDE